jgi:hypothetical protein
MDDIVWINPVPLVAVARLSTGDDGNIYTVEHLETDSAVTTEPVRDLHFH